MTHSHDASDPALAFVAAVNAREFDLLPASAFVRATHGRDLSGTAADVVRRDQDGHWQYVIDNPFGTA